MLWENEVVQRWFTGSLSSQAIGASLGAAILFGREAVAFIALSRSPIQLFWPTKSPELQAPLFAKVKCGALLTYILDVILQHFQRELKHVIDFGCVVSVIDTLEVDRKK